MTVFGLCVSGLIAGYGYHNIQLMSSAVHEAVDASIILRNHMFADMMHDALNSDVNAALLAAEKNDSTEIVAIEDELKEHSDSFIEALNKNNTLIKDRKTHEALEEAFPALNEYISTAAAIVQKSKTDRAEAMAMMANFHKSFSSLEKIMESLTELIEADVKKSQAKVSKGDDEHYAATMLSIIWLVSTTLMICISFAIINNIVKSINILSNASERVANGDLTTAIDISKSDEMGKLAHSMDKMRVNLASIISQISLSTSRILKSVEAISVATSATSSNMSQQRLETEQVAAAINEMTATTHEVARNISSAAASANKATDETKASGEIVDHAVESIKMLAEQIKDASQIINKFESNSNNISLVLEVIKNIAEQTNLLALNAAIEAARAGEQGRGFAVVADEVRTLASRTQQSACEINEMIDQLQSGSRLSVEAINKSCEQAIVAVDKAEVAGSSLATIAASVNHISQLSAQIATAAEEQTSVSEEINRNIIQISDTSTKTVDATYNAIESIANLGEMTTELRVLVGKFKVAQ